MPTLEIEFPYRWKLGNHVPDQFSCQIARVWSSGLRSSAARSVPKAISTERDTLPPWTL